MSYITNFKPASFLNFKNLKLFKNKYKNSKNKIISRNFFLFLLLLKYVNNNNLLINTSVFVKPFYKKFITVLRAPYRHKLSRHQFVLSRYSLLYTINVNLDECRVSKLNDIEFFIKKIKRFYV